MIRERRGFQKVYDLTERVLPAGIDARMPTPAEFCVHLTESTLRSHGLASEREIRYLRRGLDRPLKKALREQEEAGVIRSVSVKGVKEPYYALKTTLEAKTPPARGVRILSPFDNFIIQRKRLQTFFGFDYQIECYVPEGKRKYGYFCLPILWDGSLVGRLDAKADRQRSVLEAKSLHLELPRARRGEFRAPFETALAQFAAFNGCAEVALGQASRALR